MEILLITAAFFLISVISIKLLLETTKERNYWFKLYNELLDRELTAGEDIKEGDNVYISDDFVFKTDGPLKLNKKALEKFGEIEILANKIIEEHKNKYYGVGTTDVINAYNKACNMVKD